MWWEILSWISGVFPLKSSRGDGGQPREEEDDAQTCIFRSTSRKIGSGSGDFQRCQVDGVKQTEGKNWELGSIFKKASVSRTRKGRVRTLSN